MNTSGDGRAQTVAILHDVVRWELSPVEWERVTILVGALSVAVGSDDPDAIDRAVFELECAGPTRAIRLGTAPTQAPDRVRQRANELIHTLTLSDPRAAAPAHDRNGPSGGTDRR